MTTCLRKSVNLHTPLTTPRTERGIISTTWELMQGRLWPLVEEALFLDEDHYLDRKSFDVAVLGKIVVSTDGEQDDEILKYPRYSAKVKGGYGWDTFARTCFGWQNLIMADKTTHTKLLRVLGPLFNNNTIREKYYNDLKEVTQTTLSAWAKNKEGVNIFDAALEHSCKAVTTCFLGKEAANSEEIIHAVRNLMRIFWDNAQIRPWALIKHVGCRVFGQCFDPDGYWESQHVLEEAIEEARLSASEESFLGRLLELSPQELIDNMKMLYFAGTETTGSLINSLFIYLAANPEEQEKLREELHHAGVEHLEGLDYNILHKLPKLKAVLHESLRLVPPLPIQVREVHTKEGSYSYFVDHYHRLRDSERVGANPDQFNPERFIQDPQLFQETEKTFGGGNNPCLGKNFAITEASLMVAATLLQGSIKLVPTEGIREAGAHLSPNMKIRIHLKDF